MLKTITTLVFIFFITSVKGQYNQQDFKKLSLLEGSWTMKMEKGNYIEEWQRVNDSLYTSRSFIVDGKDTVQHEEVRLTFSKGVITYSPRVYNQNEAGRVHFTLVSISNDTVSGNIYTFENKLHDFPQQIIYWPGKNELKVIIKGNSKGTLKEIPFDFTRVK